MLYPTGRPTTISNVACLIDSLMTTTTTGEAARKSNLKLIKFKLFKSSLIPLTDRPIDEQNEIFHLKLFQNTLVCVCMASVLVVFLLFVCFSNQCFLLKILLIFHQYIGLIRQHRITYLDG